MVKFDNIMQVSTQQMKQWPILQKIICYICIFLFVIMAGGGSLPFVFHTHLLLILFLSFSIYVRAISSKIKWDKSLLYLVGIIILMVNTSIYNGSFDPEFKRYIFYGIMAYLVLGSFTVDEFKTLYLNVVTFLSVISLFVFSLSLVNSLPLKYLQGDYVTIGYYMYHTIEWNGEPLLRNASVFTEPGNFQYCLNYTFLLFLEDIRNLNLNRLQKIELLIVLIALITCASTVGYLVLMVIIIYLLIKIRVKNKLVILFVALPISVVSIWSLYNTNQFKGKLSNDNESASAYMRLADAYATYQMIIDHPIMGNGGVGTRIYKKRVQSYGALTADTGASNGVLVGMATFGVVWLLLYSFFCYRGAKKMYHTVSPVIIVLITLLIHSNEYFIFYPLIYIFIYPYKTRHKILAPRKNEK